jgi:hypothetical protein
LGGSCHGRCVITSQRVRHGGREHGGLAMSSTPQRVLDVGAAGLPRPREVFDVGGGFATSLRGSQPRLCALGSRRWPWVYHILIPYFVAGFVDLLVDLPRRCRILVFEKAEPHPRVNRHVGTSLLSSLRCSEVVRKGYLREGKLDGSRGKKWNRERVAPTRLVLRPYLMGLPLLGPPLHL